VRKIIGQIKAIERMIKDLQNDEGDMKKLFIQISASSAALLGLKKSLANTQFEKEMEEVVSKYRDLIG